MGEAYLNVRDGFYSFAYCVRTNVSTLAPTIERIGGQVKESADHLAYMDPPNQELWQRLSSVCGELRSLVQIDFFPNGSGTVGVEPEVVYEYMLEFNKTITEAHISILYTFSDSGYMYNPDGNDFQLNQTKLLEMDNLSTQFLLSVG